MKFAAICAVLVAAMELVACGGQPARRPASTAPLTVDSITRDYRAQQEQGRLSTPPFDRSKWESLREGMSPKDVVNLLGQPGGMRFLNGKTGMVAETGMIMTALRSPIQRSWTRPEGTNEAVWIYAYDGGRTLRFVIFDEIVSDKDTNGRLVDWAERRP